MSMALEIGLLVVLIAFSALYSGSEIGFYSVSPVQVDLDAKSGSRRAALMRWLLQDDAALLITILIGNNLALELATHVGEALLGDAFGVRGSAKSALLVTLMLTPVVFLFGEALPKDVFRQRPHALTGFAAPVIGLSRIVFWPLERMLRIATVLLEKALGLGGQVTQAVAGKEEVLRFLAEGRRHGVLSKGAEVLAGNALTLRTLPVSGTMVPWEDAEWLRTDASPEELFEQMLSSRFSRLPVVEESALGAPKVVGYVHQLEVLHNWSSEEGDQVPDVLERIRPCPRFSESMTLDRALNEFHKLGRRIALVVEDGGTDEDAETVLGVVSVNDLLDRISGEVAR